VNPLVASVKMSKTVEVFGLVQSMKAAGERVTSLCVGEPDFPPPQAVLDAAVAAVRGGETRYTAVAGTSALRSAIAADLLERKGTRYDAASEVLVSSGAKQSVFQAVLALCGPGDEVLIPAPYWPSYPEMVRLAGATPVVVNTTLEKGFLLTPELLEPHLTERTKCLIFCNPSNPSGAVHPEPLMRRLAALLELHPRVAVVSDEIYERLNYNPANPHVSFAALPGMFDRTITVNGFSKAYAMTGMRLGYACGPARLIKPCATIQSQLTSCASAVSQAAGVAALEEVREEEMEANVEVMRGKRDYVCGRLAGIEGVRSYVPDGAFYVLPDVSAWFGGDDAGLCLELLRSKRLALVPGESFGAKGCVRISYATSMEELEEAMDKLEEFLEENRP
jgi:aspartate/methionine/tyrosine aminotransferase